MPTYHIGCSGFSYRDWKGVFYPPEVPPRKWFEYYCTQFNTVELNVTFYKMPELGFLEKLYAQSPKGFQFSVKAPRLVTHYKKFNAEAESVLQDFYGTIQEGLRDKLGPVLFQLPPKAAYTEELMARLLHCLDPAFTNVVEFRHLSWWEGEVYRELARHRIAFVGQSHPMPLPDDVVANTDVLYYRFHGVPELYKTPYDEAFLQRIAREVQAAKQLKQVYLYFNNGMGGAAVANARQMQLLLG